MVDPINFTNYNLDQFGLESYILFAIGAAGKNALTTARLLDTLLHNEPPFKLIRTFGDETRLRQRMKEIGFGCYNLKAKGFWWIANSGINLKTCTVAELEECPGIGMKTSRFFVLHTRPDVDDIACLDTHLLHFLCDEGYPNIPKQTPAKKRYLEIEKTFLNIVRERGVSTAKFDLDIWNRYHKGKNELLEPLPQRKK